MYAVQPPGYHPHESDWQDYRHYTAKRLPRSVRPWLLDRNSLTQRLIKSSHGQFKVKVLTQQWQQPRLSETILLSMRPREKAIIREVALLCAGKPWVFARSVMPARSLQGRLRRLRKFNDSSLGEMLFRDPSMHRHPFQIAAIEGHSKQLPESLRQDLPLWGRRCRFELAGKPIMVSEIFLRNFRP
ncbi:MAG: chorismate lyase [Pseudomonadales bacterium]